MECQECSTGWTMLVTAVTVSFIHVLIVAAGFVYFRRFRIFQTKQQCFANVVPSDDGFNLSGIHPINGTLSRNSNVFFGNKDIGFRSSFFSGTYGTLP